MKKPKSSHPRKKRPNPARDLKITRALDLSEIEKMVNETAGRALVLEIAREIGYMEAYTVLRGWKDSGKTSVKVLQISPASIAG